MTSRLPSLAATLILAAATRGQLDPAEWTLAGCAQSAGTTVTLQLCGHCPGFTSSAASFTAPVQGTLTMRLDWTVSGDNMYATLLIDGPVKADYLMLSTTNFGWCGTWPCTGGEPSISVPLLAGQTVELRLANVKDGSCSGGATTCSFSEIRFTPDIGFVVGPGALDRRLLADLPGTAGQIFFG